MAQLYSGEAFFFPLNRWYRNLSVSEEQGSSSSFGLLNFLALLFAFCDTLWAFSTGHAAGALLQEVQGVRTMCDVMLHSFGFSTVCGKQIQCLKSLFWVSVASYLLQCIVEHSGAAVILLL